MCFSISESKIKYNEKNFFMAFFNAIFSFFTRRV